MSLAVFARHWARVKLRGPRSRNTRAGSSSSRTAAPAKWDGFSPRKSGETWRHACSVSWERRANHPRSGPERPAGPVAARVAGAGQQMGVLVPMKMVKRALAAGAALSCWLRPCTGRLVRPQPARRRHAAEPRDLRPAHADPLDLRGDRRGRVRRDDLLDRRPSGSRRARCRPRFDHSTTAEIVWTLIPVVILVAMAIPAAQTLVKIEDTREFAADHQGHRLPVEVAVRIPRPGRLASTPRSRATSDDARQLDSGHRSRTGRPNYLLDVDNPLVVPAGKKVRVLVTAADVIHAWWVPDFGMKKDAIPGYINELWFTRRQGRHLPRPVRRALRPRPRLHADRGRGEVAGRIRRVARRAEGGTQQAAPAAAPQAARRTATHAAGACASPHAE